MYVCKKYTTPFHFIYMMQKFPRCEWKLSVHRQEIKINFNEGISET